MVKKWIVLYHLHLSWIVRNKPLEKPYSILKYFPTNRCLHLWCPRAGRMTRAHPQMMGVAVVSREKACNRLIQPRSSRRNVSTDASPCKHDIKVFWTSKGWDWRETPRAPCGAMRHIAIPTRDACHGMCHHASWAPHCTLGVALVSHHLYVQKNYSMFTWCRMSRQSNTTRPKSWLLGRHLTCVTLLGCHILVKHCYNC